MTGFNTQPSSKQEPRWLVPLAYLMAFLLCVGLLLYRSEPLTRGSFAGLVIAWAIGGQTVPVAAKIALGYPVTPMIYRPPVGEPTNVGWLDRPLGTLLQLAVVTAVAAALALFW